MNVRRSMIFNMNNQFDISKNKHCWHYMYIMHQTHVCVNISMQKSLSGWNKLSFLKRNLNHSRVLGDDGRSDWIRTNDP